MDTRFDNPGFFIDPLGQPWIIYLRLPSADQPVLWTTGMAVLMVWIGKFTMEANTPELAAEKIWALKFYRQNRAWFVSDSGEVKTFDGTWHDQDTSDIGSVLSIAFDQDGEPWYATSDGRIQSADRIPRRSNLADAPLGGQVDQWLSSGFFPGRF